MDCFEERQREIPPGYVLKADKTQCINDHVTVMSQALCLLFVTSAKLKGA